MAENKNQTTEQKTSIASDKQGSSADCALENAGEFSSLSSKSSNASKNPTFPYTSSSKRIAKNTLMLYFRQILIMLVSLYTVRVVLATLGAEDYGIYNVVAGVVVMFGFLSGAMATASQRFFSFELGRGDTEKLKETFSVTISIYLILILIIVALAETVGLWFVNKKLVIPNERMNAARWIYQFSIANFAVTLITAPYMASIIAHEDMNVYAYASIIEAVLKLAVVFLLKVLPYDKLTVYGLLLLCVGLMNTSIYRFHCRRHYEECRFRPVWNKAMFREIWGYMGWNLFGSAVGVFNNQILNVILNQFFGPVVNAARAVSSQINSAVNSFASNFSTATRPQIIKDYAADRVEETHRLVFRACKMTFFLMFVLTLPLVLEMPYILRLWLNEVPENTVAFAQLTLIDALITSMTYPIMTLAQATGKIKFYQGVVGGLLLCNLPVAYILLRLGFPPYSVMVGQVAVSVVATAVRLVITNRLSHFSLRRFANKVVIPLVFVVALSAVVPSSIVWRFGESFLRLCATLVSGVLLSCMAFLFFGLDKVERRSVMAGIFRKLGRKG